MGWDWVDFSRRAPQSPKAQRPKPNIKTKNVNNTERTCGEGAGASRPIWLAAHTAH